MVLRIRTVFINFNHKVFAKLSKNDSNNKYKLCAVIPIGKIFPLMLFHPPLLIKFILN